MASLQKALLRAMAFFVPLISIGVAAPSSGSAQPVSFQQQVRPVLEQRCIACHGCYDAPCQLKLESPEGLARGASQTPVYNGQRTSAATPSRLFIDAGSSGEWRNRGFFSVLEGSQTMDEGLLYQMLVLGQHQRFEPNSKLPEDIQLGLGRANVCPAPEDMADYAREHPLEGMPLGLPALSDREFDLLTRWLAQGAPLQATPVKLTLEEQSRIQAWEDWLNRDRPRQRLVARWVYEHLFLAHLYFDNHGPNRPRLFFSLVRSHTPPGEPIAPVATRRPNGDPGGPFWYRLRPITETIIHKTHITYALNDAKRERMESLFFDTPWELETLPDYDADARANPFETFQAIPARARYQIMLDDAEYFVRTFIRGPVCRGQIATDVIRDQFWAVFQDPDHDLYVDNADYQRQATPLLGLPGQHDDLISLGPQWFKYKHKRNRYLRERQQAYARHAPGGPTWETLWDGDGDNSNALLTIFRHHDSASVRRGLIGDLPLTTWVMDYPLFERTYYALVVNFDVFGSVSHQAQTRLYFDLIRNGAEQNMLRYLPAAARKPVLDDWYQHTGKLKLFISYASVDTDTPTGIDYGTSTPKQEFDGQLLTRFAHLNARPDPLNRCQDEHCALPGANGLEQRVQQALSVLASRRADDLPVIDHLPEASLLQVRGKDGDLAVYTLLRNRAHSNVAFMMGESLRYQPELDTVTIYPGVLASYPNFMFHLREGELEDFVRAMERAGDESGFERLVQRFGVRRTHPEFWHYFDDLGDYLREHEPTQAGVLDLNRYQNL
ncbi:fatty acid cis/trans isomerase CTI [Alloalcanivorax xenomutans]|uniref:fatty acid cis/trans isomerase n=1 Tax=Alloalcanivorax xenomutans TaxID=1094342 RepID=UPI000BD7FFA5|nr:fatty acid cis/trans isomerase [Alloalcanivorax xenomutans]SOC04412.1 fatty acid cis/trans isomerase CTI [Alloalcanivorax xenomutans]